MHPCSSRDCKTISFQSWRSEKWSSWWEKKGIVQREVVIQRCYFHSKYLYFRSAHFLGICNQKFTAVLIQQKSGLHALENSLYAHISQDSSRIRYSFIPLSKFNKQKRNIPPYFTKGFQDTPQPTLLIVKSFSWTK